ncbi:NADPH:quinone reductase-like Zn-dependent oxidoreductase [Paraburkholderia sp. GAS199]|uniref:hypothetical protein n=1 Tax=Paraburkholderia sp. GAS199 TaxID=3035126 RepID=UPI003D25EFF4
MIDDWATTSQNDWLNGAYAVGESVMLDGAMRAPVVVRLGTRVDGERIAFTVPLRDGVPVRPDRMPRHALRVPAHLPLRDALCLPACWPKIYMALVRRLKVEARDAVLIHDAHTPAGMLACLLAASLEADVLAICDTADHARRTIFMGSVEATTISTGWPEVMREHGGADVVLDLAGGRYAGASTICARRHARIGVVDGVRQLIFDEMQQHRFFSKQLALMAVDWSPIRDATVALEAATAFDAITRTDIWTRYVSLRDTLNTTNGGESASAEEFEWTPIET